MSAVEWEYPPGSGRRASYSPVEATEMRDLIRRKEDGEITAGEFDAIIGLIHDAKVDADAKVQPTPADEVEPPVEYEPSELFPIPEGIQQRLAERMPERGLHVVPMDVVPEKTRPTGGGDIPPPTPPAPPPPNDPDDEEPLSDPDENRVGKFHGPQADAPVTERRAAILIYPHTGTARRRVLDYIGRTGDRGASDEELSLALDMRLYTAAPRRNELLNDGWIEDSGRQRKTTTGTNAAVWILTERGRREWKPAQD